MDMLEKRMKESKNPFKKIRALAKRSSSGDLSSFSSVFQTTPITDLEKDTIRNLLNCYDDKKSNIEEDLEFLSNLSAEVKAISTQAIMLHGERIKKAQTLLKKYRDGAFSAFLINTYGNRQSPYNFLQYYDLHKALDPELKEKIDTMPKQVIYSLSSREMSVTEKETFIKEFNGESKSELLTRLRTLSPLKEKDKRAPNFSQNSIAALKKALSLTSNARFKPDAQERKELLSLLKEIKERLNHPY